MLFNILSGYRDDHTKNFSFLMSADGQWQLLPAYALTFSQGMNGVKIPLSAIQAVADLIPLAPGDVKCYTAGKYTCRMTLMHLWGINSGQGKHPDEFAAQDWHALFVKQLGVNPNDIQLLIEEQATRQGIIAAIQRLIRETKTGDHVFIWQAQTGVLLKTIRVPVGDGNEGKLYAVALAPKGDIVAVAGWTGYQWDSQHSIYLFSTRNGKLLRRISGLGNVIADLAWSDDSARLAAVLAGGQGLRVYNRQGKRLFKDSDYGSASYGVDFAANGQLVSSCLDGYLRLYDRDYQLLSKKKAPGGNQPFQVAFSPNGRFIAVGFADSTKINVLAAQDLSLQYQPDTDGVNNGDLGSVTWSADGNTLYAGGLYNSNGSRPIRRWSRAGRGAFKDISGLADNTIWRSPDPRAI